MDEIDEDPQFNLNEDKFMIFDDLIKSFIWKFLSTTDIINLSMTSKGFERISIDINSNKLLLREQERSLTVREHGSFINLRTAPISRIKSINRMITLFPQINNLSFNCNDKNSRERFSIDVPASGSTAYCEYPDRDILMIILYSKLATSLLELSLPVKSDFEFHVVRCFYYLRKLEIFYSLVSDDGLFCEVKRLNNLRSLKLFYCISITKEFLLRLKHSYFGTKLTELDLHGCYQICGFGKCFECVSNLTNLNVERTDINNEDLSYICLNLKSLVSLNLNYCDWLALDKIQSNSYSVFFSNLSQLKTLSLRGQCKLKSPRLITSIVSLTSLDLYECNAIFITPLHGLDNLKYLSNLETLNLGSCNTSSENINKDFPYFPNLTILDLSSFHFSNFDGESMGFESTRNFTNLTSLTLRKCCVLANTVVTLCFLENMMNLTFLDFSSEHLMGEYQLFNLGYLTNLQTLQLTNSFDKITHLGFQSICSISTKLTSLSIQGIHISAHGMSQHLSKLSCLHSLSIRDCTLFDRLGKTIENNAIDFSLFPTSLTCLDVNGLKPPCQSMIDSIFSLQGLKELSICKWNNMDDDNILRLSLSLTKLEKLLLHSCGKNVTNTGLSSLSSLVNLKYLLINDNQFEDSSILRLQKLSKRNLDIKVLKYFE